MKLDERACPRCAEAIKADAFVCKHCGAEIAPDDVKAAKDAASKKQLGVSVGCLGLLALIVLPLAMCTPDDTASVANVADGGNLAADAPAQVRDSDEEIAETERSTKAMFPAEKRPSFAPDPPVTGWCVSKICAFDRVEFENRDWPRAWKGDYQAQRNVAWCFKTGCNGAVEVRRIDACAWRAVIIEVHADTSDDTDVSNLKSDCGGFDPAEVASAQQKAASIISKVGIQ